MSNGDRPAMRIPARARRGLMLLLAALPACASDRIGPEPSFTAGGVPATAAERRRIGIALAGIFPSSPDGRRFEDPNCGDLDLDATLVDLNADGTAEVFVQWGNTCTSGGAERSLTLLIEEADGSYRWLLGFPAFGWTVLPDRHDGWPDLSFGGPGFCRPLWTWRAGTYEFACNVATAAGGCADVGRVCPGGSDAGADDTNRTPKAP